MGSKALTVGCFAACAAAVGVASGTFTPVAYGAGKMTAGVGFTGIISTLTALVSGAGGIWSLLKSGPVADFAKDAASRLTGGDTAGTTLDAAFVTIAAVILSKKVKIDSTTLTALGELRKQIDVEVKP